MLESDIKIDEIFIRYRQQLADVSDKLNVDF